MKDCPDTHRQLFLFDYTLGLNFRENQNHIPIVRSQLTKALPLLVPEVYDEVVMACNECIPITEGKRLNITRTCFLFFFKKT